MQTHFTDAEVSRREDGTTVIVLRVRDRDTVEPVAILTCFRDGLENLRKAIDADCA